MKPEEMLQKAKIQVLSRSVFFATMILGLRHKVTTDVPTAAVDGLTIFYNPDFLQKQTVEKVVGLIMHELGHVAYAHHARKGSRNHSKWNQAGDYSINNILLKEGYELPDDGLWDSKYSDMSTEQIYSLLPDNEPDSPGGWSGDLTEPADNTDQQEVAQAVAELVQKAILQTQASAPDEIIDAGITRTLKKLLQPRLDWRAILNKYMQEYVKDDYTYSRPNRRFLPDFYLPSQRSPSIANLTVAIDTSGSVSQEEIQRYLTEIQNIRNTFSLDSLTILACDYKIRNVHSINQSQSLLDLKIEGGSYTRCEPVFKYCLESGNKPTVLIYFSDLGMTIPTENPLPGTGLIWINTYDDEIATCGSTIIMEN